jgi:hypothetical protein
MPGATPRPEKTNHPLSSTRRVSAAIGGRPERRNPRSWTVGGRYAAMRSPKYYPRPVREDRLPAAFLVVLRHGERP